MLRVQTVSLSAEPDSQHRDAREPAPAAVLVHDHAPADFDKEKFLRVGAPALARAQDLQTYLGIWAMLHKLRIAMGKRDERYTLEGMVKLDEGFFTTEVPDSEKGKPLKKGRGSQRKTKVLVMAETVEGNPTKKEHKHSAVKRIKMIVIDDLEAETIDTRVKDNIGRSSTIISDHSTSYTNFKSIVASHRPQVIPKEKIGGMVQVSPLACERLEAASVLQREPLECLLERCVESSAEAEFDTVTQK